MYGERRRHRCSVELDIGSALLPIDVNDGEGATVE